MKISHELLQPVARSEIANRGILTNWGMKKGRTIFGDLLPSTFMASVYISIFHDRFV
jgi:hypothetical protein